MWLYLPNRRVKQNLLYIKGLRNKTCFPCLHSLVKTEANVWENSRRRRLWGHGEDVYLFYKIIIFRLNKKKDDIRSANVYFDFFHETVNSHNLETANHFGHVILNLFLIHSAVKPHLQPNQNYFIILDNAWNQSVAAECWRFVKNEILLGACLVSLS